MVNLSVRQTGEMKWSEVCLDLSFWGDSLHLQITFLSADMLLPPKSRDRAKGIPMGQ